VEDLYEQAIIEANFRKGAEFDALWYAGQPSREIISEVRSTHEASCLALLAELQSATDLLFRLPDNAAQLLAFVRAYRAVDWYQTKLRDAIVEAFARPFNHLFKKGVKPRAFFRDNVLTSLQDAVLDEAFHSNLVRSTITEFYFTHSSVRNDVIHGLSIPTVDQTRAIVGDAMLVYNHADAALNPSAAHPLKLPEQ
jgi:hypothetical protein